ncbi:MAG TPA: DUF3830 family protein [Thermomicrobiales bacterium]|nr:DUF3830 family protein [Thermomicrobiales bacterium]
MQFVDIGIGNVTFRAQLLADRAAATAGAIWEALPFDGQFVHGQWSGAMIRSLGPAPIAAGSGDRGAPFQHPGLVVLDPTTGGLAICYGQGRLNPDSLPAAPIPVAQIGGDLAPLTEIGAAMQWDGAASFVFSRSADQDMPLAPEPIAPGRAIDVELDDVVVTATLLEATSPAATAAFAALLPLAGRATNTHSSGPLTRFWNPAGGSEGETPLATDDRDARQVILYPGSLYYLPSPPWRGIRIAREATMMRGAVSGGDTRLIPLARFDGDWSPFQRTAERLTVEGARPLRFRLRS